jgi:hypothetical protein
MKAYIFLIVILLINTSSYGQKVKFISRYFSHYDTANSMNCFKIGDHALSFDDKAVYIDKKAVLEKDTNSFFFLEVYSKRVLVVSYYPMSQAFVSTGPGFRPIQKVEFILLNNPKQRWLFDLKGAFNSESIVNFNELTGELELKRKITGQKLVLADYQTSSPKRLP